MYSHSRLLIHLKLGIYSLIGSLPAFDFVAKCFLHQEEVTAVSNAYKLGREKGLTRDKLIFV